MQESASDWKLISRRTFIKTSTLLGGGVGVSAFLPPFGSSLASQLWQAYTYWASPTMPSAQGFQAMLQRIEGALGDKLRLKLNLGGSLSINMADIISAVESDIIQLSDDAIWDGAIPLGSIIALPLLVHGPAEMEKAMSVMLPHFEEAYARRGVTALGHYVYPAQVIWSRTSIRSLADLSGKKYRVGSAVQVEFMRRFGAIGVVMGSSEVAGALERGIVDGVVTASAGGVGAWKDLLKSSYRIGINYPVSWIIANAERVNALDETDRETLKAIVQKSMAELTRALQQDDQRLTEEFANYGIEITYASPEDIRLAEHEMADYWEEWTRERGDQAVALRTQLREVLGR